MHFRSNRTPNWPAPPPLPFVPKLSRVVKIAFFLPQYKVPNYYIARFFYCPNSRTDFPKQLPLVTPVFSMLRRIYNDLVPWPLSMKRSEKKKLHASIIGWTENASCKSVVREPVPTFHFLCRAWESHHTSKTSCPFQDQQLKAGPHSYWASTTLPFVRGMSTGAGGDRLLCRTRAVLPHGSGWRGISTEFILGEGCYR